MPTTILLLLLALSFPSPGVTFANLRPDEAASSRCDARSRMPDVCHVHATREHPRWPCRVVAIIEDRDDDESDGELAVLAHPSPMPHRRSALAPGLISPRTRRHAVARSPILRC